MIAALYVDTGGSYFGLPDVDPWDRRSAALDCTRLRIGRLMRPFRHGTRAASQEDARRGWRERTLAAGLCLRCARRRHRPGRLTCAPCGERAAARSRARNRDTYRPRRAMLGGRRRNRCRRCDELGHNAKTCGRERALP